MAVAVPAGLAARPRPVVVWVHGAGGVAPGCGPSRTGLDAWYADDYLRHGAVVVAPDLTGLGMEGTVHPYLHGTTAGRSVLDAARAAADLTTAGAGSVVAIAGHSAGGHAVLWANQLAAGADGDGLDVRLAVPMSPVVDLAVSMDHYSRAHGQAAFPVQLAATWPGVEPVDAAAVLTPAAIGPPRSPLERPPRAPRARLRRSRRTLGASRCLRRRCVGRGPRGPVGRPGAGRRAGAARPR